MNNLTTNLWKTVLYLPDSFASVATTVGECIVISCMCTVRWFIVALFTTSLNNNDYTTKIHVMTNGRYISTLSYHELQCSGLVGPGPWWNFQDHVQDKSSLCSISLGAKCVHVSHSIVFICWVIYWWSYINCTIASRLLPASCTIKDTMSDTNYVCLHNLVSFSRWSNCLGMRLA